MTALTEYQADPMVRDWQNFFVSLAAAAKNFVSTLEQAHAGEVDARRLGSQFENLTNQAGVLYRRRKRKFSKLAKALGHDTLAEEWAAKLEAEDEKAAGSSPKYRRAKMECFVRDGFTCQYPGCDENRVSHLTAHHVIPRHAGGPDEASNLLTLCVFHHRQTHNQGGEL